jgi:CRP/FNR family cyclic AMP-dependent transcriptional regulator
MPWELLHGATDEEVRRLVSVSRRRRFARGEVVFHQGDPADSLHLIQVGRFLISVDAPRGNTAALAVRGPNQTFGEMALVADDATRSATVSALERAETLAVYRTDFNALRAHHPAMNEVLIRLLTNRVRTMNDRLVEALYTDADTRVRRRLADLHRIYAAPGQTEAVIPLTQEQLAELAGTSRATTNRVLRVEAAHGRVRLRRGAIVASLVDRA